MSRKSLGQDLILVLDMSRVSFLSCPVPRVATKMLIEMMGLNFLIVVT
jgi:hypothetical protein